MNNAEQWIESLLLKPHPEGGWYSEYYQSEETISRECLPRRFTGNRKFSTAIYFLLKAGDVSVFHRIRQDELWHFYDGGSLTVHIIDSSGSYSTLKLGTDLQAGERPLGVVRSGCLFGASLNDPEAYALVGCTVAPGFTFEDFEMPERKQLLELYPQHRSIIQELTQ
jgi:predicted cupin superfamily sugar epimerase